MRVAVASRSFSNNKYLRQELEKICPNVTYNNSGNTLKGEDLVSFLDGHEIIIVGLEILDSQTIKRLPNLKAIGKYGVGLDNIDILAIEKRNIYFSPIPGVNALSVAELVIFMSLHCIRNISENTYSISSQEWKQTPGQELKGKTFGIIGLGNVGSELERLLSIFGVKILFYDTDRSKTSIYGERVELNYLLGNSDLVTIHIPYNEINNNFFDHKKVSQMKENSILINTSRGGIVDENAVFSSLSKGKISNAYFDVLKTEPPETNTMFPKNFHVSKHIGGSTEECILRMGEAAIQNVTDFLRKDNPHD